jgi:hypothetical protein
MEKQVWFGYSAKDNRTHFFDADPGRKLAQLGDLSGTGNFTITGEAKGLNIENVQNVGGGQQPVG